MWYIYLQLQTPTQLFLALGGYPKSCVCVCVVFFRFLRKAAFSSSEPGSLEPSGHVDLANALRRLQSLGPGKQAPVVSWVYFGCSTSNPKQRQLSIYMICVQVEWYEMQGDDMTCYVANL